MSFNATFPWLSQTNGADESCASLPDSAPNLKYLLNSSLPYYLPSQYHRSQIHTNSPDGKYFAHAAQLILHNEVHGLHFWKQVTKNFLGANKEVPKNTGFLNEDVRSQTFGSGIEECTNAKEYLLEPCVVAQLHHYPVIFYQWLSAAFVEFQRVRLKCAFLISPIPESLADAAIALTRFLSQVFNLIDCGFAILGEMVENFPNPDEHWTNLIRDLLVPKLLPLLETLLNTKWMERICLNIKNMIYSRFGKEKLLLMKCEFNREWPLDEGRVYRSGFWFDKCKTNGLFGPSLNGSIPLVLWQMKSAHLIVDNINSALANNLKAITGEDCTPTVRFVIENVVEKNLVDGKPYKIEEYFYALNCVQAGVAEHAVLSKLENQFCSADGHLDCFVKNQLDFDKQRCLDVVVNYLVLFFRQRGKNVQLRIAKQPDRPMTLNQLCYTLANEVTKDSQHFTSLLSRAYPHGFQNEKLQPGAHKIDQKIMDRHNEYLDYLYGFQYKTIFEGQRAKDSLWIQYVIPCFTSSMSSATFVKYFNKDSLEKLALVNFHFLDLLIMERKEPKQLTHLGRWSSNETITEKAQKVLSLWERLRYEINLCIFNHLSYSKNYEGIPGLRYMEKVFSEMFFSVNDIHPCLQEILSNWAEQQLPFQLKLLMAVRIVELATINKDSSNLLNMLQLHCYLDYLAWHVNSEESRGYMQHVVWMLNLVHKKLHSLKRKQPTKDLKENLFGEQKAVYEEADSLSFRKLFHLVLFYLCEAMELGLFNVTRLNETYSCLDANTWLQTNIFLRKDWVRLKMLLMPTLDGNKRNTQSSVLKIDELEDKFPVLGQKLLSKVNNGTLVLDSPGAISMAPLAYCRWCGKIEGVLRICRWCEEFEDYPILTWFCSEKCQALSLEKNHEDEHARFIIILLGIADPGPQEQFT